MDAQPYSEILQAADIVRPAVTREAAGDNRLNLRPDDFDAVTKEWAHAARDCGQFDAVTSTGARLRGGWIIDQGGIRRFELIVQSPADPKYGIPPHGPGYQAATGKVYVGAKPISCDVPTS